MLDVMGSLVCVEGEMVVSSVCILNERVLESVRYGLYRCDMYRE